MCGIVGFVDNRKKAEKNKILDKMLDRIIHRGPDDSGRLVDNTVALGHRRLSIIDLNTGGQPIFNEKEEKAIIFNGEIYNYKELKKDLIEKGHVFKTNTDTEVILHGYEEYKEEILNKLEIGDLRNKKVSMLSGGQRQRVAIARALITNPELILADEPTGSLDSITTIHIMNIFEQLNKEGKTIIIVTHNLELAKKTKKCFTIKDGLIYKA